MGGIREYQTASTTNSPDMKNTPFLNEITTKTIHNSTANMTNPDERPLIAVLVVVLVVVALVGCRAC